MTKDKLYSERKELLIPYLELYNTGKFGKLTVFTTQDEFDIMLQNLQAQTTRDYLNMVKYPAAKIGKQVKQAMKDMDYNITDLSRASSVSRNSIYSILNGESVTLQILLIVCKELKIKNLEL